MHPLLINPPIREWALPNCVPLGLGYIASTLRDAGHSVEILDINAHRYERERVVRILEKKDPDAVFTGGIITVYNYLKWLTSTVRETCGDIPVIIGGSVSTSIPGIALSTLDADIACIGEGEITVPEVAAALENGGDLAVVAGIWYKKDGRIFRNELRPPIRDMDSIPFPAYDLLPMEIYVNNPVGYINKDKWGSGERVSDRVPTSTNINVTRGCPYRCTFCYHDYLGPGYRHRSPENILAEMDLLHERYGVGYFLWADDEAIIDRRFIYDFCDLMGREKKEYEFSVAGRVNLVDEPLLTRLRDAGCTMVGYGIESGSQKILDAMKKGVTVEQARNAVRLTQRIFGDADCSFMIGYPGETDETIRETEEFCRDLGLAPEVIFFATAYPGTPLYEYAKDQGLITDEVLLQKRQALIESLNAWNRTRHSLDERI